MRWRMLDQIVEMIPGEKAVGAKAVTLAEDYFEDHFPRFPVVPGVLVVEALAQLAGKLVEITVFEEREMWPFPILSMVRNAKFRKFIRPGSSIRLEVSIEDLREESARVRGSARVGDDTTTDVEMIFVFDPEGLGDALGQEDLERIEREWLKMLWPGYPEWAKAHPGVGSA